MPNDLQKLQGTWNITALETDGQKMPPAVFNGSKMVIEGNKFTSVAMGAAYEGTLELHATKKPKAFDLVFTVGPEKGNRNLGIYKLDAGIWTICLATRGAVRPKGFATKPGTGQALETLERASIAKPGKKEASRAGNAKSMNVAAAQPEIAGDGPATELKGEWAMLSGVFNGDPMDKSMVKFCKRVTRGDVTVVSAGPQVFLKARFTLDRSKNPPAIDYVNLEGASKGKSQAGIFELTGGTLKICAAAPDKPRPPDFSSKPGDGRTYTTWRLIGK